MLYFIFFDCDIVHDVFTERTTTPYEFNREKAR